MCKIEIFTHFYSFSHETIKDSYSISGNKEYKIEFLGYGSCDYRTGTCECSPGFTGPLCSEPCPIGTYGRRCMGRCTCRNGGECYHVSGTCRCPGGWTGPDCGRPCPPGRFGPGCVHTCYCHNGASCNPVDGVCKCKPGYTGNR